MSYPWPGNVRELENVITRIVVLGAEDWVRRRAGGAAARPGSAPGCQAGASEPAGSLTLRRPGCVRPWPRTRRREAGGLKAVVERAAKVAERAELDRALGRTRWRRVEAARQLKISYRTLLRKIEEHGLNGRH